MYKISDNIINFITNIIINCWVELTAGEVTQAEVKIQRGIFQRESLSLLLFVIVMMLLNYILTKLLGGINLQNHKNM